MNSPILCAVDIETTGLDFDKDHILEVGWAIKRHGDRRAYAIGNSYVTLPEGALIPPEISELTEITPEILCKKSQPLLDIIWDIQLNCAGIGVEFIVAHNGNVFDIPFILKKLETAGSDVAHKWLSEAPKLDTISDIKYPKFCTARNLTYLTAFHGFLNPFPHSALFDAFSTLKLLDYYSIDAVVQRSKTPWIVVRAMVLPPFRDNKPEGQKEVDFAKKQQFRYQECGDGRVYEKCWVKRIKEDEFDSEVKACAFEIRRIDNG